MLKKRAALLVSAAFLALPMAVLAQTSTSTTTTTTSSATVPADRLAGRYETLAGSDKNADAMVKGLREGSEFKLTTTDSKGTTTTTTINPPTSKMGYGNINIALALAEASLKEQGITEPTAEQLKAALNGGTIKTASGDVKLSGILQMRADGMGWGQIANELGFKVGDLVGKSAAARAERADLRNEGKASARLERADTRSSQGGKPERVTARVERVERPVRPERVERVERPVRPERPERSGPGR